MVIIRASKVLRRAAAVISLGMVAVTLYASPASASANFKLRNATGVCLDAAAYGDGAQARAVSCSAADTWHWEGSELVDNWSGKCLDGVWNSSDVHLWSCYGGTTQYWTLIGTNGDYLLKNNYSSGCAWTQPETSTIVAQNACIFGFYKNETEWSYYFG